MPLFRKPDKNESEKDFVSECMACEQMNAEFEDEEQRAADCLKQYSVAGGSTGFTRKFDDLKTIKFEQVPIFDDTEHSVKELNEIIDATNARFEGTNDPALIILGHTDQDAPEDKQPPIIGIAYNLNLGTLGDKNTIDADMEICEDYEEKLHDKIRFGRRSIELYSDNVIDSVAILGTTRPRKDLGLLQFSKYKLDEQPTKYFKS